MNKKLLAAAIAAAVVAAPAAFADSTVYGKFHVSIDSFDTSADDGSINFDDRDSPLVNSRASRLGFKGSEDLGNGLKAIYQFETTVNVDGGTDQGVGTGFGSQRNTFVGLAGDFGTFLVGRHDTPAKIAFYAAGTDLLGDSVIDINGGPIGVFSEFRANNAIAYVSPNFSGFTFAGAIVPGEQSGNASGGNANDNDEIADHYSLGLMYSGNGLKAGLGYEVKAELDNPAGQEDANEKFWQLGASYTMNNFTVGAHYQDSSDYGWTKDTDYTAWGLMGRAEFGNNAINLIYTNSEQSPKGGDDINTDGWGISGEHNFSKRTKAYVAYASGSEDIDNGPDSDQDVFSLGMIHNF